MKRFNHPKALGTGMMVSILTFGCGQNQQNSTVSAVTAPENRPVQSIESFWLYENNTAINQAWTELPDSDIKFFPEAMPLTSQDYFWIADKSSTVSLIPDRFQRHAEGIIPSLKLTKAGGFANLSFTHSLFAEMDIARSDYTIAPTFEISGKIGDGVQLQFTMTFVCYKLDPVSSEFTVLDPKLLVIPKDVSITRNNFEKETYTLDTSLSPLEYQTMKSRCDELGGEDIATNFEVDIKAQRISNTLTVDFPGIFVKRATTN